MNPVELVATKVTDAASRDGLDCSDRLAIDCNTRPKKSRPLALCNDKLC